MFTEVVDESLGWFLVRVEDDALVSETDQLDVLHLEDVAVGGGTREQSRVSEGKSGFQRAQSTAFKEDSSQETLVSSVEIHTPTS